MSPWVLLGWITNEKILLGNAIVPQVAYEIIKAIKEINNDEKRNK